MEFVDWDVELVDSCVMTALLLEYSDKVCLFFFADYSIELHKTT